MHGEEACINLDSRPFRAAVVALIIRESAHERANQTGLNDDRERTRTRDMVGVWER